MKQNFPAHRTDVIDAMRVAAVSFENPPVVFMHFILVFVVNGLLHGTIYDFKVFT